MNFLDDVLICELVCRRCRGRFHFDLLLRVVAEDSVNLIAVHLLLLTD